MISESDLKQGQERFAQGRDYESVLGNFRDPYDHDETNKKYGGRLDPNNLSQLRTEFEGAFADRNISEGDIGSNHPAAKLCRWMWQVSGDGNRTGSNFLRLYRNWDGNGRVQGQFLLAAAYAVNDLIKVDSKERIAALEEQGSKLEGNDPISQMFGLYGLKEQLSQETNATRFAHLMGCMFSFASISNNVDLRRAMAQVYTHWSQEGGPLLGFLPHPYLAQTLIGAETDEGVRHLLEGAFSGPINEYRSTIGGDLDAATYAQWDGKTAEKSTEKAGAGQTGQGDGQSQQGQGQQGQDQKDRYRDDGQGGDPAQTGMNERKNDQKHGDKNDREESADTTC